MAQKFVSFSRLLAENRNGIIYQVSARKRDSDYLILAPHAGLTEPHTSAIASAIAGGVHSLYVCAAMIHGLHITSSLFDEAQALEMVNRHKKVVAVHGCESARSRTIDVFVGGRDKELRDSVIEELRNAGFGSTVDTHTPGLHAKNICNRGRAGTGVQLEITRRLRNKLGLPQSFAAASRLREFGQAVRAAIKDGTV